MPLSNMEIDQRLRIFADDIQRRSPNTVDYYIPIARRFLMENGDFSRHGMITFMNKCGYCNNSLRTAYYVLKHLCLALDIKFPLDKNDLPAPPDEMDLHTPTLTYDQIERLVFHWKQRPADHHTALLYLSTIYALRAIEMTTVEIHGTVLTPNPSILVHVAKRKADVKREHPIPGNGIIYLVGYDRVSQRSIQDDFHQVCRYAGVKTDETQGWHSIRRAFATICEDKGIKKVLVKRYMRWSPDRRDMADVYFHKPFPDINEEMFKVHPFLSLW